MNLLDLAFAIHLASHVDSALETTRIFWRTKFFGATPEEASDTRPWVEIEEQRRMAA